ncbi:hypothetical protein LXA43DRAFT_1101238 [Ganoderma leucocontextum]|nr:hypothetical protein LXA43DRAFT_1101238 [Ganoderma leucocontextum]
MAPMQHVFALNGASALVQASLRTGHAGRQSVVPSSRDPSPLGDEPAQAQLPAVAHAPPQEEPDEDGEPEPDEDGEPEVGEPDIDDDELQNLINFFGPVLPPLPQPICNRGGVAMRGTNKQARLALSFMPRLEEIERLEAEGLDGDFYIPGAENLQDDDVRWVAADRPTINGMKTLIHQLPWESGALAYSTDSLWSLVDHCYRAFAVRGAVDFVAMLNLVQLSMKVDSMLKAWHASNLEKQTQDPRRKRKQYKEKYEKLSMTGIYRRHLENISGAPEARTFRSWVGAGYRYATLAGAEEYGLPRSLHCGDLEVTDQVFSTLNTKDFKLIDRDWDVWRGVFPSKAELADLPAPVAYYQFQQSLLSAPPSAPPTTPATSTRALTPESPLSGLEEEFNDDLIDAPPIQDAYVLEQLAHRITVSTLFNPSLPTNKQQPYPKPGPARD